MRGPGTPLPTLQPPYCGGAKTTNRPQSDTSPDDWHRRCATFHCIVLQHKAALQCIVKGEVVNSCLPSHGVLFMTLRLKHFWWSLFFAASYSWHDQGKVMYTSNLWLDAACWIPVDTISIFPSMHTSEKDILMSLATFQRQRFFKYSRTYWVNSGFQGCQGTANRICFPQQQLPWTWSSTQHLCWAPSDESFRVCQAFSKWLVYVHKNKKWK